MLDISNLSAFENSDQFSKSCRIISKEQNDIDFLGAVVDFVMTNTVSESVSANETLAIQEEIANAFEISVENVTLDIQYVTEGTMILNISGEIENIEILENSIEEALAEELNIHPSNIDVTFNETSGEVSNMIQTFF